MLIGVCACRQPVARSRDDGLRLPAWLGKSWKPMSACWLVEPHGAHTSGRLIAWHLRWPRDPSGSLRGSSAGRRDGLDSRLPL